MSVPLIGAPAPPTSNAMHMPKLPQAGPITSFRTSAIVFPLLLLFAGCSRRPEPLRADDARAPSPPAPSSLPSLPTLPAAARLVGRSDGARFAWSGTTIRARFTGPSVAMRLRSESREPTPYSVYVDDRPPTTVDVPVGEVRVDLASGLDPSAPHLIRVVREVEAFAGVHELLGVELGPSGAFLADKPPALRIEIIGDSITCGYGILGDNGKCRFSYATERSSRAFGAVTAEAIGAEVTTIAWSGKGVFQNNDGTTADTMRDYFELAIPAPKAVRWSFADHPAADAVVIALGTNDYSHALDQMAFEDAYVKLARRVREVYPAAFVFLTTPPMLGGGTGDAAQARLEHVVSRRAADGDTRIELVQFPREAKHWGCDHHPDVAMNHEMADRLVAAIQKRLPR